MKRLLLDTNVVLDFALKREPFYENAQDIFVGIADNKIHGFITASMATDIFICCKKQTVGRLQEILLTIYSS